MFDLSGQTAMVNGAGTTGYFARFLRGWHRSNWARGAGYEFCHVSASSEQARRY